MIVDPATGEVRSVTATWADLRARIDRTIAAEELPSELERQQVEVESIASELADFLIEAQKDLDTATNVHDARLALEMEKLADRKLTQTMVNKIAGAQALDERRDMQRAQTIYDYGKRKLRALEMKHYGLMNRNRTVQGMAGAAHRRNV